MGGAVSSGRNNDELVDNLKNGQYIRTRDVERVFRALDRAEYMCPNARDVAYKDLAWRNGPLHLSAPCIYSEVMEALELKPGLSFLNVGSGTGYLSTLVGLIIGSSGISHGVEAMPVVLEYANKKVAQFIDCCAAIDEFDFCIPKFFGGNGLCLAPQLYDRVYCGAGVLGKYDNYFKQFLKVGGVLVMPLSDKLVKTWRVSETAWRSTILLNVSFARLREPTRPELDQPLTLEDQEPPSLQMLCRSAVRAQLRAALLSRQPELREPESAAPPPPAARPAPRRICIPLDANSDEDINELHELDEAGGAHEMNALLSLVLTMGQNRAAGSLRFDNDYDPAQGEQSDEERDVAEEDQDDIIVFDVGIRAALRANRRARARAQRNGDRSDSSADNTNSAESSAENATPAEPSADNANPSDSSADNANPSDSSADNANPSDSSVDNTNSAESIADNANPADSSADNANPAEPSAYNANPAGHSAPSADIDQSAPSSQPSDPSTECARSSAGQSSEHTCFDPSSSSCRTVGDFQKRRSASTHKRHTSTRPRQGNTKRGVTTETETTTVTETINHKETTTVTKTTTVTETFFDTEKTTVTETTTVTQGPAEAKQSAGGEQARAASRRAYSTDLSSVEDDSTWQTIDTKRQKLDSGIGEGTASSGASTDKSPEQPADRASPARSSCTEDYTDADTDMPWPMSKCYSSSSSGSSCCSESFDESEEGGATARERHRATQESKRAVAREARRRARGRRAAERAASPSRRRVQLSLAMKRSLKELPLPPPLLSFLNYGRCYMI